MALVDAFAGANQDVRRTVEKNKVNRATLVTEKVLRYGANHAIG